MQVKVVFFLKSIINCCMNTLRQYREILIIRRMHIKLLNFVIVKVFTNAKLQKWAAVVYKMFNLNFNFQFSEIYFENFTLFK